MPKKPTIAPRKPPAAAEAFVSGGATGTKRHDAKASTHKAASTYYERKDGETLRRLTVYLPDALAKALRARCANEDRAVSDALAEAAKAWLGK